jgi:hypothetical protein
VWLVRWRLGLRHGLDPLIFFADDFDTYDDMYGLLFGLAVVVIGTLAITGSLWGLEQAFKALNARIRFPDCSGGPAIHARPL